MLQSFQRPTARKLPLEQGSLRGRGPFPALLARAAARHGRGHALRQDPGADHGVLSWIPRIPGPVIELGPGTGPVTDALIRRGVAQDRLVLVEYNPEFCQLLKRRFPKATIIQGDAYDLKETLSGILQEPAAATVSSLPLFTKPMDQRLDLLETAQELMHPGAPFIQFTYAVVPPIPARSQELQGPGLQPDLAQPAPGPRVGLQQGQTIHERCDVSSDESRPGRRHSRQAHHRPRCSLRRGGARRRRRASAMPAPSTRSATSSPMPAASSSPAS